eukprot:3981256-Amphidinium_carterae.3
MIRDGQCREFIEGLSKLSASRLEVELFSEGHTSELFTEGVPHHAKGWSLFWCVLWQGQRFHVDAYCASHGVEAGEPSEGAGQAKTPSRQLESNGDMVARTCLTLAATLCKATQACDVMHWKKVDPWVTRSSCGSWSSRHVGAKEYLCWTHARYSMLPRAIRSKVSEHGRLLHAANIS